MSEEDWHYGIRMQMQIRILWCASIHGTAWLHIRYQGQQNDISNVALLFRRSLRAHIVASPFVLVRVCIVRSWRRRTSWSCSQRSRINYNCTSTLFLRTRDHPSLTRSGDIVRHFIVHCMRQHSHYRYPYNTHVIANSNPLKTSDSKLPGSATATSAARACRNWNSSCAMNTHVDADQLF